MNSVSCIFTSLLMTLTSFGQTGSNELNLIANQKGVKLRKPPMMIYWFMQNREEECDRLFWYKDKLPTPIKNKLHYRYRRVDLVMKFDDFYLIAFLDHHKGRDNRLILLDNDFEIIEEYVFYDKRKKNTYSVIRKKIKSGKLKTKAEFLKGIEEFEKTIPKNE